MIRSGTRADLPLLTTLCSRSSDSSYDLARVAEEKCFGPGLAGPPQVRIHGNFEGVAVTCGKYLRLLIVDREARRRGVGTALLRDAESIGATTIGAEPGNYFTPGSPAGALDFFRRNGYLEVATTHNMEATLEGVSEEATRARPADRVRVLKFIEQSFSAAWRFECERAFTNDPPTIFIAEGQRREITGFAAHETNNRGLGFFGPTGVLPSQRGRGIGRQLLLASLTDLRRLGFERAVIPWTDAIEFYAKSCGAVVTEKFVTMRQTSAESGVRSLES